MEDRGWRMEIGEERTKKRARERKGVLHTPPVNLKEPIARIAYVSEGRRRTENQELKEDRR
jgi:hypothetical protein